MTIKQMTRISLFSAFISVSVYLIPPIQIPLIQVPFTLQTVFVMLAGFLFTPIEAFLTVFIYVFIGAIGLPVYSGARSGLSVLFGPTGGFIMMFPLVSLGISLMKSHQKRIRYDLIIGFLFGIIFLYMTANIWVSITLSLGYWTSLLSLLPFVPFDIAKLVIAYVIYLKIPSDLFYSSH